MQRRPGGERQAPYQTRNGIALLIGRRGARVARISCFFWLCNLTCLVIRAQSVIQ